MIPIPMRWTGAAMEPLPRFMPVADQAYVIGEVYRMEAVEDRSDVSHRHEFAFLREAWKNLPEAIADQYPSPEHLRKRALIEGGFYDETITDAGSNAAALRVAASMRAMPEQDFAIIFVRGGFVIRRTAKSQSRRAMDRAQFQASKDKILEIVSELVGVTPSDLQKQAA